MKAKSQKVRLGWYYVIWEKRKRVSKRYTLCVCVKERKRERERKKILLKKKAKVQSY